MLSIIIPVFNAEKYIDNCVESILKQTFNLFEVLLINDGSSDKSLEKIESLSMKDSRVRVLTQKNKGVSSARNLGIANSKGEYICFMDSDDELEPNMLRELMENCESDADLVITNYKSETDVSIIERKLDIVGRVNKAGFLKSLDKLYLQGFLNVVWNKLYKKDIIIKNNIFFNEEINMGEDILFNLEYFKYCENFKLVNLTNNYIYKYNNNSLTRKADINYLWMSKHVYESLDEYMKFEKNLNLDMQNAMENVYRNSVIGFIYIYIRNTPKEKLQLNKLSSFLNSNSELINNKPSFKEKLIIHNLYKRKYIFIYLFKLLYEFKLLYKKFKK